MGDVTRHLQLSMSSFDTRSRLAILIYVRRPSDIGDAEPCRAGAQVEDNVDGARERPGNYAGVGVIVPKCSSAYHHQDLSIMHNLKFERPPRQ